MISLLLAMSLARASVLPPRFSQALVCPCPTPAPGSYFRTSSFAFEDIKRPMSVVKPGMRVGTSAWREIKANDDAVHKDADGNLLSTNLYSGVYVEWQEPVSRKALLFCYAKTFVINGRRETGHVLGWGIHQLVPVSLRKGTNSYMAAGAVMFQLLPVGKPIGFLEDTAVVPDTSLGEGGPFDASIVATNATGSPRRIRLKTEVDGGPVTVTSGPVLPAMDSRIVPFKFCGSSTLRPGIHKLKLWADDADLAELDFTVAKPGEARRCTYVSKFDGMVRGYSVRESLTRGAGQPIVLFTYGGGKSSISNLSMIRSKSWCHVVSPEFRTTNWDGLGVRDALESLEVATKRLKADPTRTFLLGHSMGGHGVYQMASENPKAFAGIGLSAAWLSDFTYAPGHDYDEVLKEEPIAKIFRRAMAEVDLEGRLDQIASIGNVWMVHGNKDQAVPISESFRVMNELERRGTHVGLFVRDGANHFWQMPNSEGNQYDYPPLFAALHASTRRGTGKLWAAWPPPPCWADCMARRSVAVYGTHGTQTENEDSWNRARKEAAVARETFGIDCEVVSDAVTPQQVAGRNVILFGTPTSNALWKEHPSAVRILDRARRRGEKFTSWMIQARKGDQVWSAIGGFNEAACRLAYFYDPANCYRRFPQWLLFSDAVATRGLEGVAAAGFASKPEAWR